jgi:hypothetical protein
MNNKNADVKMGYTLAEKAKSKLEAVHLNMVVLSGSIGH